MNLAQTLGRSTNWKAVAVWLLGIPVLALLLILGTAGYFRISLAISITALLIAISLVRADIGLIASMIFLGIVGELRRLLIYIDGWPTFDPLLLVSAVMAITFVASAAARRELKFDTTTSRVAALLVAVMALQIFNPRQGGLIVGISGAMFYMIPLLWFFAARSTVTTDRLETLLFRVLVPLGILATIYGLYQTFFGYLPHQMEWYRVGGYGSLGPLFALKPISFFSSSTEHGTFLAVIVVVLISAGLRRQRSMFLVAAVIAVSVFLVGSRGPIVRIVFTISALWAILSPSKSVWIVRGIVGLTIGLAGLYWSSTQVAKIDAGGAAGFYIERQTSAFMNPLDKKESTAPLHFAMLVNGIRRGISTPLGNGLGSTTKAAAKFDTDGHSSEIDFSNVFLSTGIVGGLLYTILLILIARSAIVCWQHDRSVLMLCIVGVLIVTVGDYLIGRYFLCTVIWIIIGVLDRRHAELVNGTDRDVAYNAEVPGPAHEVVVA